MKLTTKAAQEILKPSVSLVPLQVSANDEIAVEDAWAIILTALLRY
jgi:hypothetical protein